ncbi:MAG: hypothetical protein HUU16_03515 [Candidatus Omnitrophica bacterium]|nr:hypothetical protein [Candidatus Omnitrophota bacterium]
MVAQAVQPATAPAPTPTPTSAEPGKSPLNFNNAELNVVLKYISDKTGKPVVQTGELKDKKITIINPRTQTDQENLQLLYKMLSLQGIAVVDMDELINVMPLVDARKGMLPIAGEAKEPSKVEEPITYSRRLRYVKAPELVDRLKPLVRDPDGLLADAGTNTILYTDTRSFVNRFEELVTHLDTEPFQEITTSARPVRNVPAAELVPVAQRFLRTFAGIAGEATPQTVVRVEPSLNTLILKGPAREVQALTAVLDRLDDRPRRELQFTTQRRKVNHADPETLIREGNAFLHRQSALLDFMGDMSKTTMMYEPVTRELVIRGPSAEIEALVPFLDELDAPLVSRPRKINYAEPQPLVDDSLKMLVEQYAEEGRKDFKHSITWKTDSFDPSTLIFRGPAAELDRLFPILDRFDKPTTTRSRRFYKSPEEVFPEAFDLLLDQYLQEGRPSYKHAITWRRDPLNAANIVIRGPEEELNRLFSILDRLDKSVTQRTRQIYSATPEVVIPQALERVIKMFAEEGVADLEPSIQWKRDDFNPSLIVFRGPPDELDHLFQALDLLDKPTTTQQRRFYNRSAEEVIPEALALMLDQYKQEGRPDYRHSITWRRDTLNPALMIFKGPPEELARLMAFIEQLDKVTTERSRRFYTLKPEEAIPQAISLLIDRMAEQGQSDYRPSLKWKPDRFNPSMIVFQGPPAELDGLIPLLDQIDKPTVVQQRRFFGKSPEEVLPRAYELLLKQYEQEGWPGYQHSLSWTRDPLNPALINLKGPQEELSRLAPLLERLDKTLTERSRVIQDASPEQVIPDAIARMIEQFARDGQPNYEHSIEWRRDEFNPAQIIFRAPPAELDALFPILDRVNPPLVISSRAIQNMTPELIIQPARERLKQYFVDQNRPEYEPKTTFRIDPLNRNLVLRGPQEEITALTTILSELDTPRMQHIAVTTQEFPYGFAEPADLIQAASQYLTRRVAFEGKPGDKPGVTFQVNPLTRSITLRGPATQLSWVTPILSAVEQTTRRGMKPLVIYPKKTSATVLYSELYQLVSSYYPGPSIPQILQLPRLDAVLVSARDEDMPRIKEWVEMLDREGGENWAIRVVPIKNSVPSTVASAVRTLIPPTGGVMHTDDAAARIIIRDSTPAIERIVHLIDQIDQPVEGEDLVMQVKNLKTASAYYAYNALNEFSQQLALIRGKSKTKARVVYEPTSSSILFFGTRQDVDELMQVAEKLDRVALADTKPRIVKLNNAQASTLYGQLSSVLPRITSQQSPPVLIPDTRLNALIVATAPSDATKVLDLIRSLDSPGGEGFVPKFVRLKNAEPYAVSSALSPILSGSAKIIPDQRTSSLIIYDSTENVQRLMPFIEQLDATDGLEDFVLETYKPTSAYSYYLYLTLSQYASLVAPKKGKTRTKTVVQYDTYTNMVILMGPKDEVQDLIELAKKLDTVTFQEARPKIIPLKNLSAPQFTSRLSTITQGVTSRQTPPMVIPDARLNSLIVAGTPADVSKIVEIVQLLDIPGTGELSLHIHPLKNADASTLTSTVSSFITSFSEVGKVFAEPRSNSVLILDSTENVQRLLPIIERLDSVEGLENFVLEIYKPTSAYSYYLYLTLSQYTALIAPKKGKARSKTAVQYDTYTNMVILMGPKDEVQDLIELAKKLDTVTFQEARPKIIPLKNLSAPQFTSRLSGITQGVTSRQTPPLVIPDTRLNSLIVAGTPADVSKITEIVQLLDIPGSGELSFHIHPLKNAEAGTLTSTLSSFITYFSEVGKVFPEPRTNSLLILDSTETIQKLIPIIEGFDTIESRERFVVDVIPTKTANVYAVYNPLSMYAQQLATLRGNQRSRPQVIVDPSTQSIIVIGRREDVDDIKRIAEDLDKLQWGEGIEPEFIPLKNATASTVASSISRILPSVAKGGASVQVVPDDRINQVIVVTKPDDLARIKGLIEKLDMPDAVDLETRIIPIENAVASYVYSAIYSLKSPRGMVTYDVTTNSVILRDNPSALERLVKLVKELDVKEGAGLVTKIIPLKNSSASSVYYPVTTLKSARGYVNVDVNSNSLIIRDTSPSMAMLEEIIADLDMRDAPSEWVTEIKRLRHLDPNTVSNLVTQLSTQIYQRQGRQRPRSFAYPEPSSNSVVIIGVTEEVKPALDLIERLEQEGQVAGNLKLFFLKNTRAQRLATQLRLVFQSTRRGTSGLETAVISDEFTNSIIAIGSEADLERLEELITKLDIPNAGGLQVEIFPLEGVSASTLSGNLQPLLGPQGSIFAEAPSNSLVLIDSPEVIQRIGQIVKELSQRKGRITTRIRKLEFGVASNLATPINQYLQIDASRTGRPYPSVNIYPEPSSNSVLIFGPTNEVVSIERLIDQLDTQDLGAREPRIFPLRYIPASQILAQFMQSISQSTVGALRPVAFAEPTRNLLIVMAADTDLKRIEEVLKQLDVPESAGLETRVYQLKHSSAATLAPNLAPPITSARGKAFADTGTNSLVVIDTPESHARVREFIDRIDLGRGQIVSRVRRMENATISTLSGPLQQFLAHQARTKGLTTPLTQILSDPSSNTVIIYGPTDEVEIVMGLLDELDAQSLFDREPEIVPLTRAQAAKLAPVIQQLLAQDRTGANAPRVVAEPESNTLIVVAPRADLLRAKELIARLDQVELTGIETRVFHLKNADPQTLATNLRGMVGNPAKLFFDPVSNSLVYTDTPGNLDNLAKIITQLDTFSDEAGVMRVVRPLRNTSASTVDVALSDFAQYFSARKGRTGRPLTRVAADVATNSVLIIGPTDEVQQMVSLLEEMDRDNLRERQPKTFFLKQAQAQQVATQLTTLMAQLGAGPNMARIVGNQETNSLLVLATPTDMVLIEQMITSLDSDDGNLRRPQIYHLKNADAVQLVTALRPTIGALAMIAAHADSNSVLYTDTETNVQRLFAILEQLDAGSRPEEISSEIVALVNTKAGNIMQPLQTIVTQISTVRRRANKPPLQTFADPEANAIVVVGATEEVTQIARIVRELDAESLTERKPEIFTLEFARASDLARSFTTLFATTSRYGTQSRIVADEWSNSLIVIADPRDMTWIRQLIKELDTREGRKRVVEIFILENADASSLAEKLTNLFVPGTTTGGRSRTRSYWDDLYGYGRRSMALTEGEVSIIPDLRLNALVVTAEPQDMTQVAELIEALDIEAPNLDFRIYHVENGESEQLADTLTSLFTDTEFQSGYYYPVERDVTVSGLSGKIRVISEPTTNSLIVLASSPRAFEVVEQMLKELDRPSVQAGRTNIIQVRNARAKDLQDLLTKLFRPEESAQSTTQRRFIFGDFFGGAGGGAGGGSFSNLIGKVRIEADTRTNSLLVITPELYRPSVEQIISELDRPTNQVLLEVLIVEVTLGNEENKGIQWGVDPTTGEVGRVAVSNTEILTFDNDRTDFLSPDDFTNNVYNFGADSLQFFSLNRANFQAVLNFLETCRQVNVQSRPNILTADNRKARVEVVLETPFVKEINVTNNTTNSSVEYRDVGLILDVTPRINSATEVTLDVRLQDGNIDPTIPPLNGTAFTFSRRQFETQLVVNNHHTVVLAGVISERSADQTHQVPVLWRLPVVGNKLFTNKAREKSKVELLTFITPYILRSRMDVLTATEMTRDKSGSQALKRVDLTSGDWPDVYVDEQQPSREEGWRQPVGAPPR